MKIEIYSTTPRRFIKPRGVSSGGSFSFFSDIEESLSTNPLQELPNLNPLFTLQENTFRSEVFQRADDLLDILDDLRKEILLGTPSQKDLKEIERLAQNLHNETQDQKLKEILMEIETRAAVELAKISKQR